MEILTQGEVIHTKAYDYTLEKEISRGLFIALLKVHNDGGRDPGLRVIVSETIIMSDDTLKPDTQIGTFQYKGATLYVISYNGQPTIGKDATQCSFQSGTYTGELKNGLPHGLGRMNWNNHCTYVGQWNEGHADGFGILTQPDGLRYEGHWKNNQKEGHGLCFYPNGNIYQGDYRQGVRQGYGILRQPGGGWYEGAFENDRPVQTDTPANKPTVNTSSTAQPSSKPSVGYRIWCKTWRLLAAIACFGLAYLIAMLVIDFFSGNGPSRISVKGIIAPILMVVYGIKLLISFFTHLSGHTDD